jgi:hypothetical protein
LLERCFETPVIQAADTIAIRGLVVHASFDDAIACQRRRGFDPSLLDAMS